MATEAWNVQPTGPLGPGIEQPEVAGGAEREPGGDLPRSDEPERNAGREVEEERSRTGSPTKKAACTRNDRAGRVARRSPEPTTSTAPVMAPDDRRGIEVERRTRRPAACARARRRRRSPWRRSTRPDDHEPGDHRLVGRDAAHQARSPRRRPRRRRRSRSTTARVALAPGSAAADRAAGRSSARHDGGGERARPGRRPGRPPAQSRSRGTTPTPAWPALGERDARVRGFPR